MTTNGQHSHSRSQKSSLSLMGKLDLILASCSILSQTILRLFLSPFRGDDGPPTFLKDMAYHVGRCTLSRLSPAQLQYVNPTDHDVYMRFAKDMGFTPRTIGLSGGTRVYCLGKEDARKVILYFHGGGYVSPGYKYHWGFVWDLRKSLSDGGQDVAVLYLDYDLAPGAPYPRQLQQAVTLLDYTVNVLKRRPSDIMLAGDSAGGNLALGVLSHLSHPHPEISRLELKENLRGAVLISPWVSFDTSVDSMTQNERKDFLTAGSIGPWVAAFLSGAPTDPWNQPLMASPEWWEQLKVDEVLINAGADEIMIDDIRAFAKRFKSAHQATTILFVPEEPHIAPIVFRMARQRAKQDQAVVSWVAQRF